MSTATRRTLAPDDEILIMHCGRAQVCRLSVDDFDDPDEVEITGNEIHVTAVVHHPGRPDDEFPFCFKLSTTSAEILVRQLAAAIRRRP